MAIRAGPFKSRSLFLLSRKLSALLIVGVFFVALVLTQFGRAQRLEKGAELAFSRARQLLHEADKENRGVRPLPMPLARV